MLNVDKNLNVIPDPETLRIRPFKLIWDRDKTKKKEKALDIFAYIYFKYNPKSNYLKSAVGKELEKKLKKDIIGDLKWKADKTVKLAEEIYADGLNSVGMKLLNSGNKAVDMVSKELDDFNFDDVDDKKEKIAMIKDLLAAIDKIDVIAIKITNAYKKLKEEHLNEIKKNKKRLSHWELPPSQR